MIEIHELVAHLSTHAPGFARRLAAAGLQPEDLHSMESLAALPVMRKDDLVAMQAADPPFAGFLACPPGDLRRIFQSPGPIYDPEARRPDDWRWAPALRAAGFGPGDLVFNAFGYHLTPAGAMFEEGLWAAGCAVIPGGVGNQEQQVQAMAALGATGYVGLPSYLKALLDKAGELGLILRVSKAFVTAEPLPPSLRAHLNERGVTVRQGYGTAECGNLGYECKQQDGWHLPDDALVQVCDLSSGRPLPPGEPGEIVVTLFRPEYALVRFGTGDLSTLNTQACACGRPAARLMGWQGRVGEAVKVRGMFLHPRQLSAFMARFAEVARWQAVVTRQEHKDYLALRLALQPGAQESGLAEQVIQSARQALKFQLSAAIVPAEALPPGTPPILDERTWE